MLLDGNGTTAIAEIMEKRELKILTVTLHEKPSKDIFLFIAAPRKQKLDQIFKQATELGVTAIAIIRCEYSVALPEGSSRWDAMLLEACKQSNNPFLPQVLPVMKFQEAIDFVEKNSMLGVFGDMVDICIIGGFTGVLASAGIGALFNAFVKDFPMSFSTGSIVLALTCSTLIGVIFGYMPARRASMLNPVEALAQE